MASEHPQSSRRARTGEGATPIQEHQNKLHPWSNVDSGNRVQMVGTSDALNTVIFDRCRIEPPPDRFYVSLRDMCIACVIDKTSDYSPA